MLSDPYRPDTLHLTLPIRFSRDRSLEQGASEYMFPQVRSRTGPRGLQSHSTHSVVIMWKGLRRAHSLVPSRKLSKTRFSYDVHSPFGKSGHSKARNVLGVEGRIRRAEFTRLDVAAEIQTFGAAYALLPRRLACDAPAGRARHTAARRSESNQL